MKNNQLDFDVYCGKDLLLVEVRCYEGVGAKITYDQNFDIFAKDHPDTALNVASLLASLDEIFK